MRSSIGPAASPWNETLVRAVKPLGLHVQATPAALLNQPISHSRQGSRSCSSQRSRLCPTSPLLPLPPGCASTSQPSRMILRLCRSRKRPRSQPLLPQLGEALGPRSGAGPDRAIREPLARSDAQLDARRAGADGHRPAPARAGMARGSPACLIRTPFSARCWRWTRAGPDGRYGDSLRTHYRRALLARMFASERIEQVMAACREKTP